MLREAFDDDLRLKVQLPFVGAPGNDHASGLRANSFVMYALGSLVTIPPPMVYPPPWRPIGPAPAAARIEGAALPTPPYGTQPLLPAESGDLRSSSFPHQTCITMMRVVRRW